MLIDKGEGCQYVADPSLNVGRSTLYRALVLP